MGETLEWEGGDPRMGGGDPRMGGGDPRMGGGPPRMRKGPSTPKLGLGLVFGTDFSRLGSIWDDMG